MTETGLRFSDLTALGKCAVCGGQQLDRTKLPLFYVVEITRAGFDAVAIQRMGGLVMQIGAPLASVMGPDEPLAKVVDGPHRVFVHEECAGDVHHLMELIPEETDRG